MKTTLLILTLSCLPALAGSLKARRQGATAGERAEQLLTNPGPRLLERFDTDKDGKLSDEEKSKARETIKARAGEAKGKVLEKFDTNGDGKLDESERTKARETVKDRVGELRQRLLKRFDSDGDGKLNEAERAKAREALEKVLSEEK